MKKSFIKKTFAVVLTCALTVGIFSQGVFAKTRDFYDSSSKIIYSVDDLTDSQFDDFVDKVYSNPGNFVCEFNGKYYNYNNFLADYGKNKKTLGNMGGFTAALANSANIQQGFDPSAYNSSTDNPSDDFSVISID